MDVAAFLEHHPPFDELDADRLSRVATSVEIEHFAPGVVILEQAGEPSKHLYVIRKGTVDVLDEVIDQMGPGESFGMWSLLGGFAPTATVRASDDVLCYLVAGDVATDVLGSAPGIAFVMRSLRRRISVLGDGREVDAAGPSLRAVGSLVRRPVVATTPDTPVADAAATMARERVSCLLIETPGGWGILTDRDLRTKVVAEKRDAATTPVAEVMTTPVRTITSDAMAGEILLEMLERGFHHFPVVDAAARPIGVVTDTDLMGLGRHTPFAVKSAIERAGTREAIAEAARELPHVVETLVAASADPVDVGHVVALSIDAMTRRLLELAIAREGEPPAPWAWLALGSAARGEQALRTDQDHAIVYDADTRDEEELDPYFARVATFVTDGLEAAGIPRCDGDVMASNRALRRSLSGWREQFRTWMRDPGSSGSERLSIAFDYRRVAGPLDAVSELDEIVATAPEHPIFVRHLGARALDQRPPTGFVRDLVVESKGEHAGTLDVKHRGIAIVGNLARGAAIARGLTAKRTTDRLRAAAAAGVLDGELRDGLDEAFRFLWEIRLRHHVRRLEAEQPIDDFVDPAQLGDVARQGLKEAFKVIARAQRTLSTELDVRVR